MLPSVTETDSRDPRDAVATAEDIATLNRMAVERSAAFTRVAGTAVLVAGLVGVLAWLWYIVRLQLAMEPRTGLTGVPQIDGLDTDITFLDRVDVVSVYFEPLVVAALAAGIGLALRGVADYMVARTGGSLTGFRVGDDLTAPTAEVELEQLDPPAP
jgi:hypothetical protein